MLSTAVFPGSFDPITIGHHGIILRGLDLFETIIIAIGSNADKKSFFSLESRMQMISLLYDDQPRIQVEVFSGLTIDFCRSHGVRFLLRGLRTSADFEYERVVAHANRKLYPDIETVFLLAAPEHSYISSSLVKEILAYGGDASSFLPPGLKLDACLPGK
ncbi:MAG TPA: pantetheine-phosphate adenylyltransferase [Bacteroidales bacterium]|jgi:pantetheine-phosphate adenylyltransferase|nr:pantetheine-phosphate adenylyltransferase [Bacteroidales bacterium]MDI9573533.1 pantetheine-phosphate adenylyltransferase [Bacteroidota bacterium]OQC59609.1 MAG: Phosphopantetheine adenylyltransferase [Bacteroidetes bacterium ADurb.Bin012]MBP9511978.1 pantetheine-phosphate adenylyltransferase [Bacteroidales bacterium]MBP9588581.1 pantetheine-phosphate adenylyltransferase [Bacteroidales bacterium]